jgi:hypothetical protein
MEGIELEHKKLKRFMRESVPLLNARRLNRLSGKSLFEMQAYQDFNIRRSNSRFEHTIQKI